MIDLKPIKAVAYCYPTSDGARALGRYAQGCFAVQAAPDEATPPAIVSGPFDTLREAESDCMMQSGRWSTMYLRHPLPGSRFEVKEDVA